MDIFLGILIFLLLALTTFQYFDKRTYYYYEYKEYIIGNKYIRMKFKDSLKEEQFRYHSYEEAIIHHWSDSRQTEPYTHTSVCGVPVLYTIFGYFQFYFWRRKLKKLQIKESEKDELERIYTNEKNNEISIETLRAICKDKELK